MPIRTRLGQGFGGKYPKSSLDVGHAKAADKMDVARVGHVILLRVYGRIHLTHFLFHIFVSETTNPKKNIINKIAAIDVARLPAKQLRLLEAFEGQSLQEVLKHLERIQ